MSDPDCGYCRAQATLDKKHQEAGADEDLMAMVLISNKACVEWVSGHCTGPAGLRTVAMVLEEAARKLRVRADADGSAVH